MENIYRLIIVKFEFIGCKCLLPIISKWDISLQAKYEIEIINKIIDELKIKLGIENVFVVNNKVDKLEIIERDFAIIFSNVNITSQNFEIKSLSVDLKRFKELNEEDYLNNTIEKFDLFQMKFPVRVFNQPISILENDFELPIIVIEE